MILLTGKPKNKGFTLVEVMVAVVILAVGITYVLGSFSKIINAAKAEKDYINSLHVLNNKIWELSWQSKLQGGLDELEENSVLNQAGREYNYHIKLIADKDQDGVLVAEYKINNVKLFGYQRKK